MKVRYLLLALFVSFEVANFTGFSWTRLRRVSDDELINSAIRFHYPGIYSDVTALKADYSSFSPEAYYWTDLTGEAGSLFWNKFFGFKLFQVRLPDAVVMVTSEGQAQFSRSCGENWWCSPAIEPDHPRLGVVGTVQDGPPGYPRAQGFAVEWVNGSVGSVFISGNCFAAFSESKNPKLSVGYPGKNISINIAGQYGYRLVAITLAERSIYASARIAEPEFTKSKTCDPVVRAAWPNVGGFSWKR